MFNNYTWTQIQKHLKYQSQNSSGHYVVFAQPGNKVHSVKLVREDIHVADKKSPDKFELLSKDSFEAVYNELVYNRELTHSEVTKYTKEKKWAGALAAILALLPDVTIDKKTGTLKYR